jgi:hypothetical protein
MVTRLSGGLTPADGADPRTFPAIWNATAVDIETAESEIDTLQSTVTGNGTAITALQGSAVALGSAVDVIEAWDLDDLNDVTVTSPTEAQVLAYSTAVSGWVNADAAGGGKILQVVSVAKTDTFSTTSSSFVTVTGLSASITPSSTSSKILVLAQVVMGGNDNGTQGILKMTRGGTDIYRGDAGASSQQRAVSGGFINTTLRATSFSHAITYLDSPSTTSSTTYQIELNRGINAGQTAYINRSNSDGDANVVRGASSITLMEVAG